jgi:hypothetical protein
MAYIVLGGLVLLLVAAGIGMALQERKGAADPVVIYGVDDSVEFVWHGLAADSRSMIGKGDVRRILEWEMHYLQQPHLRDGDRDPVIGGIESAQFVQEQAHEHGRSYEPEVILEVFALQTAYLDAIGAIGGVAEGPIEERDR